MKMLVLSILPPLIVGPVCNAQIHLEGMGTPYLLSSRNM